MRIGFDGENSTWMRSDDDIEILTGRGVMIIAGTWIDELLINLDSNSLVNWLSTKHGWRLNFHHSVACVKENSACYRPRLAVVRMYRAELTHALTLKRATISGPAGCWDICYTYFKFRVACLVVYIAILLAVVKVNIVFTGVFNVHIDVSTVVVGRIIYLSLFNRELHLTIFGLFE